MLFAKIKDIKNRNKFSRIEKKRLVDKFISINFLHQKKLKNIHYVLLQKKSKKKQYSKVRLVRRCIFNNRNRGVLRSFGISRIYLRELMQFGLIPGYLKAVW